MCFAWLCVCLGALSNEAITLKGVCAPLQVKHRLATRIKARESPHSGIITEELTPFVPPKLLNMFKVILPSI